MYFVPDLVKFQIQIKNLNVTMFPQYDIYN